MTERFKDDFELPSPFAVSYDPQTRTVQVDPSLFPAFDDSKFRPDQVAALLSFATPALYEIALADQDLLHERFDPRTDPLLKEVFGDMGGDVSTMDESDIAQARLIHYESATEANSWSRSFLVFLDQQAPLVDGMSWVFVLNSLREQASPMFTEDNPLLRARQLALGIEKSKRFNQDLLRRLRYVIENPGATIDDVPNDYQPDLDSVGWLLDDSFEDPQEPGDDTNEEN